MRFRPEEYHRAGIERLRQAKALHDTGDSYALSMYCSGLAVECILRAYLKTDDEAFDGRHDLPKMLRAGRLLKLDEEFAGKKRRPEGKIAAYGKELRAAMNEVASLWNNGLRFGSEHKLAAVLVGIGRHRGIRGSHSKKASSDLREAAQTIVDRGQAVWISRRR